MRSERAERVSPVTVAVWAGFHGGFLLGAVSVALTLASASSVLPAAGGWRLLAAAVQGALLHGFLLSAAMAIVAAAVVAAATLAGAHPGRVFVALPMLSGSPSRLLIAASLFVALLLADRLLTPGADPPSGAKNLVLIVVDALRADRLGCYGYPRPTSPNIDALAERSVVFERAVAQYPATGPSFGSLFTGKYPRRHGLSAMDPRLWLGGTFNLTLAEILAAHGYRTGAIITGSLTRQSGLARGFQTLFEEMPRYETYDVRSPWQVLRSRLPIVRAYVDLQRRLDPRLVVTKAERWIERQRSGPFFLFLHLYDTHAPYDPPADYVRLFDRDYAGRFTSFRERDLRAIARGEISLEARDLERLGARYDAEVRSADESVGRILAKLRELGLTDRTIVALTADHGEELYEHGVLEHGHIFNTNLLVPLLLSVPGSEARRISGPVELIDVPPTLLALLEIPSPADIDGRAIALDPENRAEASATAFAEAGCGPVAGSACRISVQDLRWKLTIDKQTSTVALFDLQSDPLELRDVATENAAVARRLETMLRHWDAAQPDLAASRQRVGERNPEIERRLRALGYVE
ncbi:MAG: sulfatase [Candidatus Binatia bacterium]